MEIVKSLFYFFWQAYVKLAGDIWFGKHCAMEKASSLDF